MQFRNNDTTYRYLLLNRQSSHSCDYGIPIRYADDVDVAVDGKIYFSDASTKFGAKESEGYRVIRFWITGQKKGQSETFIGLLPSFPDKRKDWLMKKRGSRMARKLIKGI